MKYIAVAITLVVSSTTIEAQSELEYFFSHEVEQTFKEHINSIGKCTEFKSCYLVIYNMDKDVYDIVLGKNEGKGSHKDKVEFLLNLTNRFAQFGEYKLPVILYTDFKFGVYGRSEFGIGIRRWAFISEGYSIRINGNGEIIK